MIQDDMSNWGGKDLTSYVKDLPLSIWQERAGLERLLFLRQTMHKPIKEGDYKSRRPIMERANHQWSGHEQPSFEHTNFS
jgi:hypothetical protein